jgi:Leucine-rich repeat (LRR) protein
VITGSTVQQLTTLTYLNLSDNSIIGSEDIGVLKNLTSLFLIRNPTITDSGLQHLVNLTTLSLWGNRLITDLGLQTLFSLKVLDISDNSNITFNGIRYSTDTLQELYMNNCLQINESDLCTMPKLAKSRIYSNKYYNPFWFNI